MKKVGAHSKSAQMHLVILVMNGSEISGGVPLVHLEENYSLCSFTTNTLP